MIDALINAAYDNFLPFFCFEIPLFFLIFCLINSMLYRIAARNPEKYSTEITAKRKERHIISVILFHLLVAAAVVIGLKFYKK